MTGNDTIDDRDPAYEYRRDLDSETQYWGWLTTYFGGGYIANLGSTQDKAFEALDKLKADSWFDRYTRALMVEFNIYNAHSNLFTKISMMFEIPSYGAALTRTEIRSVKMYRYFGNWGVFALATEIILILLFFFLLFKMFYNIYKQGCCKYLKVSQPRA